mmetsp:Transcript_16178/g.32717  ORF Transcript_16178/g.32717 Transcript_16178/m.32717 type:complete len:281 (+) Transcript_16178:66-908(+)
MANNSHGCTPEPSSDINWWFELGCVSVALALLVAAETYWGHAVRNHPHRTIGGAMQAARRSWVSKHLGSGMLPVNTMRDFMKAAQFMGRTSVVVVFAVATYAISVSGDPTGPDRGTVTLLPDRRFLLFLKLVSLLSLHSFNFVAFTQAVRYLNHVNFLMNTPSMGERPITEEVVYKMLLRATTAWGYGLKGTLITFPLLMWIFGGAGIVLGMLGLIGVKRVLDFGEFGEVDPVHAPGGLASSDEQALSDPTSDPPVQGGRQDGHEFGSSLRHLNRVDRLV